MPQQSQMRHRARAQQQVACTTPTGVAEPGGAARQRGVQAGTSATAVASAAAAPMTAPLPPPVAPLALLQLAAAASTAA